MYFSEFTAKNKQDLLDEFGTSLDKGLSDEEVKNRTKQYGSNEVESNKMHWWQILFRQFSSPFIYFLFVAAALSFLFKHFIDGGMILLFFAINTGWGFYQEYHSERALQILKKFTTSFAKVRREGKQVMIAYRELVPGDIVILKAGDRAPADIRLLEGDSLSADESVLTGESVPSQKKISAMAEPAREIFQADNVLFSGTIVVSGEGAGVVVASGKRTVLGEIARLVTQTPKRTIFQKEISGMSRFILKFVLATLAALFIVNFLMKGGKTDITELLIFFIVLAVAVIPEALPVVMTFSLSRGALRLAKNKVIVKRLPSIEDLGSIEVLCTDKTGTLTENKLKVADMCSDKPKELLFWANAAIGTLHEAKNEFTNPFDTALRNSLSPEDAKEIGVYAKIKEIPFDPIRRKDTVLVLGKGQYVLISRGAPEELMKDSRNIESGAREIFNGWIKKEGERGRRVLAIAKKEIADNGSSDAIKKDADMEFLGMISFTDPLKKSSKGAVEKAKILGIDIKILTGDRPEVAGTVAHQIGLVKSPDEVITGEEFEALSFDRQKEAVHRYAVFARVSPQQKHRIIELLQNSKEVGFLGEGVNDAPALKAANVGIAVEHAADIAQESADIVLLGRSLEVIVNGIKEGREVFANTKKYIEATLASNLGNFFAVAIASLFIDFLPMLPLQILLVNLLSDFPMIAVATDNVDPVELKKPKGYNIKNIAVIAVMLGLVSSLFDFIIFGLFYRTSPEVLQTNWFIASIITELIFLFSIRTKRLFFRAPGPSMILALFSFGALLVTMILPFSPFGRDVFSFARPTAIHMMLIAAVAALYFVATETVKLLYYRFSNHKILEYKQARA